MRHPPAFWSDPPDHPHPLARLLSPLAAVTGRVAARRSRRAQPLRIAIPVISIGNIAIGGQGKTPLAIAIANHLHDRGIAAHLVTRGYGGSETGPHRVDPAKDSYQRTGDEALLLAYAAPTWVARDRAAGARAAMEEGAEAIILDDGHQNFSLAKDVSLVAVDAGFGFGNERILPAGPLRESIPAGLARANAVVLTGKGDYTPATGLPVLRTRYRFPAAGFSLMGSRVVAFAGIARPERFFDTLRNIGATLIRAEAFPDHHPYHPLTLLRLMRDATAQRGVLVTTEKDAVRIPPRFRTSVMVQKIAFTFEDEAALDTVLAPVLER